LAQASALGEDPLLCGTKEENEKEDEKAMGIMSEDLVGKQYIVYNSSASGRTMKKVVAFPLEEKFL
jgi:hypothetical protein